MARWGGNGARVMKRVGPGLCMVMAAAVAAVVGAALWKKEAEAAERCVAREEPTERRSVPAVGRWDGALDEAALLDGVDLKRYKTIICTPETLERNVESILTKDTTCEIGIGSDKSSDDHFALSSGLSITRPPGFDRPLLSLQYLCADTLDCKGSSGSSDVLEVSGRFEVDGVAVDVAVASIPLSAHVSCGEDTAGWNTVTIDLSYVVDFKPVEGNSWRFISVDISADSNAVLGFDNVEYISEQGLTGMLQTQDIVEITNVAHAIPIPFWVVHVIWGFLFLALCKSLRDVWVNRFVPVTRVVATYTVVLGFALAYLTVCIIRYPSVSKDIYDHFHTAVNEQALGLKSLEYVDLGSPAAMKPLLEKQDFPFMLLQERGVLHRTAIPFQDRAKLSQLFSPQLENEPASQVFLYSAAVLEDEMVAQVNQKSLSAAGMHLLFGLGLLAFWRKPETRFLPWMLGILAATTLGISIWFAVITAQANPAETYVAYLETLDSSGSPAFIQVQALADLERDSTSGDLFATLNATFGSECYRSEEELGAAVEAAKGAGISSDVVCLYNNHVTITGSSECLEYECTGERVILASKGSQDVKGVTIHGQVSKGASLTLLLFAISNVVVVGLVVLSRRMSAPNPETMKAQVQVSSYVAPGVSEMSGAAFANSPWRPTDRSMAGAPSGPDHASSTELDDSWQVPQYSRSQWIGQQDK